MVGLGSQTALLVLDHSSPPTSASCQTFQPSVSKCLSPFNRVGMRYSAVRVSSGVDVVVRFRIGRSAVRGCFERRGVFVTTDTYEIALAFPPVPRRHRSSRFECFGVGKDKEGDNASSSQEDGDLGHQTPEKSELSILKRWDVPWDGKATTFGMVSWFGSFLLTGLAVSVVSVKLGFGRRQFMEMDEQSVFIFIHQLLQTVAGLSAINLVISPFKPYPPDFFYFDWRSPFNLQRGWLLWGSLGVLLAGPCVIAAGALSSLTNGQLPPRDEADALAQLLPLIGSSPLSTASLIVVTGVLAPVLEESVFRGFFLTSLTKWVPTPAAIVISAGAFALAHLTPGEFPQLFALGLVLGLSYAHTRNLLTPVFIHSMWNSGVVILLTLLRLQGYDIKELL